MSLTLHLAFLIVMALWLLALIVPDRLGRYTMLLAFLAVAILAMLVGMLHLSVG